MTAAEDIELSHLEEKLKEAQRKLEDLKSLLAKKCDTWRSGLDRIQDNICKTENTIASCEELLANKNDQRWKQRVKRKAKEIFEERRVKRRALSNQGRPCLLDSEDEEFLAKSIEDKATYHGRRKDTVMYTNHRVKSRD
jgi:NCAIR mutase (PurE)-related protein